MTPEFLEELENIGCQLDVEASKSIQVIKKEAMLAGERWCIFLDVYLYRANDGNVKKIFQVNLIQLPNDQAKEVFFDLPQDHFYDDSSEEVIPIQTLGMFFPQPTSVVLYKGIRMEQDGEVNNVTIFSRYVSVVGHFGKIDKRSADFFTEVSAQIFTIMNFKV